MNFTVEVAPEWSDSYEDDVNDVSVSSDGEYIAVAASEDGLYKKDSSTPLFHSTSSLTAWSVDISADGEYK